jgi:hypothetical protein
MQGLGKCSIDQAKENKKGQVSRIATGDHRKRCSAATRVSHIPQFLLFRHFLPFSGDTRQRALPLLSYVLLRVPDL